MDYDEISVPHEHDVEELSEALFDNFNFSEPDNPSGSKSDMLHYSRDPDGEENGYLIITEDQAVAGFYNRDVDDSVEKYLEMALDELGEKGETIIPVNQLYDDEPATPEPTRVWTYDKDLDVTLDRDSEYF